jgi:hypothetical protein
MEMTSHNTTLTPRRDGAAIKYLPIALAVAALTMAGTASAFAAAHHHHHARVVQSLNGLHMYAGESLDQHDQVLGDTPTTESRAAAIHDCNNKAAAFSFSSWQTEQFSVYSSCMTDHGQTP